MTITFHPTGIQALADEWAGRAEGYGHEHVEDRVRCAFQPQVRGRKELEAGRSAAARSRARGRVPRRSRPPAPAHRFEGLLAAGVVRDYAELAPGARRARVSQIMALLNLAPDVQEQVLFLPRFSAAATR